MILLCVTMFAVSTGTLASNAAGAVVARESLIQGQVNLCKTGLPIVPGVPGAHGYVSVGDVGASTVVTVSLRNAIPNTRYAIDHYQTPSGAGCNNADLWFTTNSAGNATGVFRVDLQPDTEGLAVIVINYVSDDFYQITRILV